MYNTKLPSVATVKIDEIIQQMVKKVESDLRKIVEIFKLYDVSIQTIELGFNGVKFNSKDILENSDITPPNDLIEGIYKILDFNYENNEFNVLGVTFNKNHNVAVEIAKILEAARKRDKESLVGGLEIIINKLKQ